MKKYVDEKDLDLINLILQRGNDVKLIRTSHVVKILSCEPKVMRKKEMADIPDYEDD